ncbi:MAG: translation initiation factor IF-2 subunit gamma [Candidatus Aenigmatarchaeota archaeon]|nr:MAG: translation initiation factor IF-2 subunit gamma [Candidatus Aenigmarchaeota archaeon]
MFTLKHKDDKKRIPELNIGLIGHVDHGKTTLTEAFSGKWTDTHSEEIKRGITIRIGYADATLYKCKKCGFYSTSKKCPRCFSDCEILRTISLVDLPGHETLMATVLSGASLIDAALLLIAANEKCPQPQTIEHLLALEVVGIKHVIIVQNKIDLVDKEQALKNYKEIKNFIKGTSIENAPIIPLSAQQRVNIDKLIEELVKIPKPERDLKSPPKIYIARSFDINKPGTRPKDLKGGVLGGTIIRGVIKKGDEIEIRPNPENIILKTKIAGIQQAGINLDCGEPGGLVGIMTTLDPSLCRADNLSGYLAGKNLPDVLDHIKLEFTKLKRAIKLGDSSISPGDNLMINVAVSKSVGQLTSVKKKGDKQQIELKLKLPICAEKGDMVAISKLISGRWHLIGYGKII